MTVVKSDNLNLIINVIYIDYVIEFCVLKSNRGFIKHQQLIRTVRYKGL